MKRNRHVLFCFLIFFVFCNHVYAKPPVEMKMTKGDAVISALSGSAQAKCSSQENARYLKVTDVLQSGCEVSTKEKSRQEFILPDKSIDRLAENTRIKILQVDVNNTGQRDVRIFITLGKIWSNVRKTLGTKGRFEVSCENAVAGVRGTIYRMNVEVDKSALVKVYDGEVNVAGPTSRVEEKKQISGQPQSVPGPTIVAGPTTVSIEEWVYIIKSMQQIRIKSDGKAEEPKNFTEAEDRDDWVAWNKVRDNNENQIKR